MAVWLQDTVGSIKELRCGLGNRARSAPSGEAHWLVGIGIEDKEGLRVTAQAHQEVHHSLVQNR
jgi:hypothetical protein